MTKYILILISSILLFASCEKIFLKPGPDGENQVEVFDEFWNIYNEKYAMFEFKGVDWQASYDTNRALVDANTSDEALFEIIGSMVLSLRDGHTDLTDLSRDSIKGFDILKGAPENFEIESFSTYINAIKTEDFQFFMEDNSIYTLVEDNIGYIFIPTFDAEITDGEINTILSHFKDTKGLIIDVRNNTGGDPSGASRLAKHLTNIEVSTGFERFKTGSGKDDFSDSPAFNRPANGEIYTKPIIVLTNGLCYSATTTFIYQTNPLEHITFIGSRTGGGSGSVADGFLSNGWKYSLSTSEFIDHEGRHLDDGFDPDIEVWIDESNTEVDEVIERAIEELN